LAIENIVYIWSLAVYGISQPTGTLLLAMKLLFDKIAYVKHLFLLRSDSISKGSVWVLSKGKCGVHFVYLVVGIWRGPNTNKQNSTPIYSLKEWTIHGMNLFCLSRILKSPNFTTRNSKKHYPSLCRRKDMQS